jgi:NOL1/NOP2/fmu family ribosome biogenesis protein
LIYSTCSYSRQEDEEIADWLVDKWKVESVRLKAELDWGIVETASEKTRSFGYRFYPDKVKGEGFFIAAFKKTAVVETIDEDRKYSLATPRSKETNKKESVVTIKEVEVLKLHLLNPADFFFFKQNDEIVALPIHLENELTTIQSALYIKKAGVKLGVLIRGELIPAHELAISNIINPTVPRLEIDKETALQYLRKADISLESELRGWVLLTYQLLPIGWVKILPGRTNNYYPKEWRILHK